MSKARDLAGLFNLGSRSGTTDQRPATADVGDIYYNGTTGKTEIYTTTGWKEMASGIPFGNTAARPAAVQGQPYFNGETQRLELFTGTSWENIVQEVPGVASISGNYSEATNSGVITINGTNFVSGAYATAIGANGVQINAASTTYVSLVQLTATFTGLSNSQEPYDIKVTNPSNLFGIIPDALYINASPVWQTASGSLGTFGEQVSISVSATATDSDSTITYALASGSTLPTGVTLNSSSGLISGTLPNIDTDTTYNFTINATDGLNVIPRNFSITSIADIALEYLVIAGGGSGASAIGGGGGAGGMREGSFTISRSTLYNIVVGAGGASPGFTSQYDRDGLKGENSRFASTYATGGGGGGAHTTSSAGSGGYTDLQGGSGGGGARHTPGGGGGAGGPGGNATGTSLNIYQHGGNGNEGGYSPVEGYAGGYGLETSGPAYTDGNGGIGRQSSITGVATYYAGGGGGGGQQTNNASGGLGGLGGGGRGRIAASGDNATGHGSGGGGAGYPGNVAGGAGSGGLVVLAYPSSKANLTVSGGLTYTLDTTTRSGYKVYKFTAGSGTVTF